MLGRLALFVSLTTCPFYALLAQSSDSTPRAWSKPMLPQGPSTENLCRTMDHIEGYEAAIRTAWFLRCGHGNLEAAEALNSPIKTEQSLPPEPYIYPSLIIRDTQTGALESWIPDLASCAMPPEVEWGSTCKGLETCDAQGVCPSERRKWRRDSRSDILSEDGKCDSEEDCVLFQSTVGIFWMKHLSPKPWNHTEWSQFCRDLSYGSYTDWRLPSKTEAIRAYLDAIWKANRDTLFKDSWWWGSRTSTSSETKAENIWWVNVDTGVSYELHQTYNPGTHGLCVRP